MPRAMHDGALVITGTAPDHLDVRRPHAQPAEVTEPKRADAQPSEVTEPKRTEAQPSEVTKPKRAEAQPSVEPVLADPIVVSQVRERSEVSPSRFDAAADEAESLVSARCSEQVLTSL